SFDGLEQVEKISLSSNNLKVIPEGSFMNLESLQSIFLDRNKIKRVERGAFHNLTILTNVFLQRNRLEKFSMEMFSFGNMKDDSIPSIPSSLNFRLET
ncbi:MAG: leucine-rich repeat domain-containing protein, partial [Sphingobacteriales bacterium]